MPPSNPRRGGALLVTLLGLCAAGCAAPEGVFRRLERPKMPPDLRGSITRVDLDGGRAAVDVGSANGLAKDAKLIIYRHDLFVGYLKVVDIAPREAAGVILDMHVAPTRGDRVTSMLD